MNKAATPVTMLYAYDPDGFGRTMDSSNIRKMANVRMVTMMPGKWYKMKLYPRYAYNDTNTSGNWKIGSMGWRDVEYFNTNDVSVNQWSIVFEHETFSTKQPLVQIETAINVSWKGVRNGTVYTTSGDVAMRDDTKKVDSDTVLAKLMERTPIALV